MWQEEQSTDTVGVTSSLGEAFINIENIHKMFKKVNKVSIRINMSKINRGSGVLVLGHVQGRYKLVLRWVGLGKREAGSRRPHTLPSLKDTFNSSS